MKNSPQWKSGRFVNSQPIVNDNMHAMATFFRMSPHASPKEEIPVVKGDGVLFQQAPPSGLRVTWFGHSSVLVEIENRRVLLDPVWGDRASPLTWVGPKRWYPPTIPLEKLPAIDAVLISHDHFDHLNHATIVATKDWDTTFVVPLGVGAHLEHWGVKKGKIVELDWWQRNKVGDLEIVCTPARHASGRNPLLGNRTLWAGFALLGQQHRVFFSGDTGLFTGIQEIGDRLGPFDLTMIEIGAYNQAWPDWHIGPEQAVQANQMLRGRVLLPVHWGLFNLATHGWTEPIERAVEAAQQAGVQLVVPRPGGSVEPTKPPELERWWPDLPWRTVEVYPLDTGS